MLKTIMFATLVFASVAVLAGAASAQAPGFEKKNYNYSEWTKGRFSEAVTVTGPGKMIFLAGVGAEDENGAPGAILYKGDFASVPVPTFVSFCSTHFYERRNQRDTSNSMSLVWLWI